MNIYNNIPQLKQTSIALGCFDGVHLGHAAVIRTACSCQDDLLDSCVFSFNDDDIPYKQDGKRLLTPEDKRECISRLGVHHLIIPAFESVRDLLPEAFFQNILLDRLDARCLVCGENYRFGQGASGNVATLQALCEQYGVMCRVVPPVTYEGAIISSSRVKNALEDGEVEQARQMLGRLFSYRLKVVHGRQLGRQLGTPTLNQYFPAHFLIPRYGVYASVTEIGERRYPSVTNIGVKPTVGWHQPLSETWIPDFSGDLYGRMIRVGLVRFMRDECRFNSIEELKQAILQDGVNAKRLIANDI